MKRLKDKLAEACATLLPRRVVRFAIVRAACTVQPDLFPGKVTALEMMQRFDPDQDQNGAWMMDYGQHGGQFPPRGDSGQVHKSAGGVVAKTIAIVGDQCILTAEEVAKGLREFTENTGRRLMVKPNHKEPHEWSPDCRASGCTEFASTAFPLVQIDYKASDAKSLADCQKRSEFREAIIKAAIGDGTDEGTNSSPALGKRDSLGPQDDRN